MNEIICPNCKKAFKVDEAGFASILKQVRDHQFEEELQSRLDLANKEKESAVQLAVANTKNALQEQVAQKERELVELKSKAELYYTEKLTQKDTEISQLKSRIENVDVEKELAVTLAVQKVEKEKDTLANALATKELEKESLENSLKNQFNTELQSKEAIIKYKDEEIARFKEMKQNEQ
mgnify:FL=1